MEKEFLIFTDTNLKTELTGKIEYSNNSELSSVINLMEVAMLKGNSIAKTVHRFKEASFNVEPFFIDRTQIAVGGVVSVLVDYKYRVYKLICEPDQLGYFFAVKIGIIKKDFRNEFDF